MMHGIIFIMMTLIFSYGNVACADISKPGQPPKIEIIDYAKAGNLPPFFPIKLVKKYKYNPILLPELRSVNSSEAHGAFNPAVIRGKDGVFYMFYRAQDVNSVS